MKTKIKNIIKRVLQALASLNTAGGFDFLTKWV